MATSDVEAYRRMHDEFTECSICTTEFTNPRMLPCMHTFCLPCLQMMLIAQQQQQAELKQTAILSFLPCPLCRANTPIPADGLNALPTNFLVARLIEIARIGAGHGGQQLAGPTCEACARGIDESDDIGQLPTATKFCPDCVERLCSKCGEAHRKNKLTHDHQLIELTEKSSEQDIVRAIKESKPFCREHVKERCTLFCLEPSCNEPICIVCAVVKHGQHRRVEIEQAAAETKSKLAGVIEQLARKRSALDEKKKVFGERLEALDASSKTASDQIRKQASSLQSAIDACRNRLLKGVEERHLVSRNSVDVSVEEINLKSASVDSYATFCRRLLEQGNIDELLKLSPSIIAGSKNLMKSSFVRDSSSSNCELAFVEGAVANDILLTQATEWFGTVAMMGGVDSGKQGKQVGAACPTSASSSTATAAETSQSGGTAATTKTKNQKPRLRNRKSPPRNPPFQLASTSDGGGGVSGAIVHGIASNGEYLYVVCRHSKAVEIYDVKTLAKRGTDIAVPDLVDAVDMVCCTLVGVLYISDSGQSVVFRVSLGKPNDVVASTGDVQRLGVRLKPYGMSVSRISSNVIVSCGHERCLLVYTAEWKFVCKIQVGEFNPWHAVQTGVDQFVLCQRGTDARNIVARVTVDLTSAKNVYQVKTSQEQSGAGGECERGFKDPSHVAVDESGNVLVADSGNARIVMIDNDFKSFCQLTDKLQVRRINVDWSLSMLYVGLAAQKERIMAFKIA